MPIFEYRCEDCGKRFDVFFRSAEAAEGEQLVCAECGSGRVKKMFSVIGIGGAGGEYDPGGCGTRST